MALRKLPAQRDLTVGFTGTQEGMTARQCDLLEEYLRGALEYARASNLRPVFRHGDCIGSDDQAATMARWLGFHVVAHPCTIEAKRSYNPNSNVVLAPQPPLDRNKIIVRNSDWMVATPKEEFREQEPVRSGTWATIRYARKLEKHVTIIFP